VANRPIYVALAVTVDGERDILGLWAGEHGDGEGAKYWLRVLAELKNRGVGDVCIVVCDGLKGLPEAIEQVWPQAVTQTCIVHLLRNSFRYASRRDWAQLAKDLKPIYTAPTEAAALERWPASPPPGRPATRPSSGCGSRPGQSSCPSWPSTGTSAP
jgi:putative transposase